MSVPFKQERKVLPCGCMSTKIDVFPYFRAIKYCEAHAKEHETDLNMETALIDNNPKYKAREADIERATNYLMNGHVSNTCEISEALGMRGIFVALSVSQLIKKGVVGVTSDNPHRFFFKPR